MTTLREIDSKNWKDVCLLKVLRRQEEFVASNAFYLSKVAYEPDCFPFGIYEGEKLAGFCMYSFAPEGGQCWIDQLMVEGHHQSKGIGRAAMNLMMGLIRQVRPHGSIYLSFEPWNETALRLYESLGFVPDGRMEEEDVVYRLDY